jgi:hypothetical protein
MWFPWGQKSVVGIVSCYGTHSPEFDLWWEQGVSSSPEAVLTGSGAHPALSDGYGALLGGKVVVAWH